MTTCGKIWQAEGTADVNDLEVGPPGGGAAGIGYLRIWHEGTERERFILAPWCGVRGGGRGVT